MVRPILLVHALVLAVGCGSSSEPVAFSSPSTLVSAAPSNRVDPDVPSGAAAAAAAEYIHRIEPVVHAFANGAPFLTPDGKTLVFTSTRDGLPQLYVADATRLDSMPLRIATPERVTLGESFDGKTIIFRSDQGADENWSIFRVGLDGSGLTELTPGAKLERDRPRTPARVPTSLYFSAREHSRPETSIVTIDLATGAEPRTVYQDPVQGQLTGVSPDGAFGLYNRVVSDAENILVLVDFATGNGRPIYPPAGQVGIADARFSADGKRIFVASDGGGEGPVLVALDARTGAEKARYAETTRTVGLAAVEVSAAGNLVALQVDAGHRVFVRLFDPRSLRLRRTLDLPVGNGAAGGFSADGKQLTVTWSTPDKPADVYAAATGTGEVTPLRADTRPSLASLPPIEVSTAQVTSFDGTVVPINVYLPSHPAGAQLPVIVSYHGGPSGVARVQWSVSARFFTSLGYAYVEPNVRGSSGYGRAYEMADNGRKRLDAFKDVEAVGRWAAEQLWADPDRLVIYGGSYGGYTVLVGLTRMPDLWRAGVDLFGVVNLKTFMRSTSGFIREVFRVEFGDPEKDAAFLDTISPLRDVDQIRDPLFVYAGANDPRVPRGESDQIVAAMRQRGVPVEYMVKDNEGHSLSRRENQIEFFARVAAFLDQHLSAESAR